MVSLSIVGPLCVHHSSSSTISLTVSPPPQPLWHCLLSWFVLMFALGAGPVPGLLLSEILPDRITAKAMAVCIAVQWVIVFYSSSRYDSLHLLFSPLWELTDDLSYSHTKHSFLHLLS